MKEYELHPEAYIDLNEIGQHIADGSPAAEKRVVTGIFDANTCATTPAPNLDKGEYEAWIAR
jgi:plasmid stabilization system protein ParE